MRTVMRDLQKTVRLEMIGLAVAMPQPAWPGEAARLLLLATVGSPRMRSEQILRASADTLLLECLIDHPRKVGAAKAASRHLPADAPPLLCAAFPSERARRICQGDTWPMRLPQSWRSRRPAWCIGRRFTAWHRYC